jgi:hypothetical protein
MRPIADDIHISRVNGAAAVDLHAEVVGVYRPTAGGRRPV